MRCFVTFFAVAAWAGVSALVSPVDETACIAEYCAGNFPEPVQAIAPTPYVSSLDALTNAERLVRGMTSEALVPRRSCAYLLFLYDKSV